MDTKSYSSSDQTYSGQLGTLVANSLGLPHIAGHLNTVLLSFLVWNTITAISSFISPLISQSYPQLPPRSKSHWNGRFTSTLHSIVIIYFAWPLLFLKDLDNDRAFGWDERAGTTFAIACGFIWDIIETTAHYEGMGFVVHGVSCFTVFLLAFRPFLAYYGPRFLMWELSTPLLNVHWFLDKTKQTGTWFQLINGIILMTVYVCARLIYGGWMSIQFAQTLLEIRSTISWPYLAIYGVGDIMLQSLNVFWFYKMISAMRKRFQPGVGSIKRPVGSKQE